MKRHPYIDLWLILALGLAAAIGVALYDGPLQIGSYSVKKAPFRESLLAARPAQSALSDRSDRSDRSEQSDQSDRSDQSDLTDEQPQRFLIFGDSMTPNLARRLADYAGANGHIAVHSVNWDSSNSISWAESDRLEEFIAKYEPTFIIVCLGSNESFLRDPSIRVDKINRIIEKFNGRPYLWIGPPSFGSQGPYNEMLARTLGEKNFFRSDTLDLERGDDHIHPIQSGSNKWMDAVMAWLPRSAHPFTAQVPAPGTKRALITYDSYGPPKKYKGEPTDSTEVSEPAEPSEFSENSENSDNPEPSEPAEIPETPVLPDSI
ncbi:MAG: hypothetical protein HDR87_10520 [Bacteroides sp.]|nr:hypothetical protein [Bacteroides sp.]